MKAPLAVVALLAFSSAAEAKETVLPGVQDLPLLGGLERVSCGGRSIPTQKAPILDCAAGPATDLDTVFQNYTRLLMSDGWSFVGGAGPQFWFERRTPAGCAQLFVTGSKNGDAPRGRDGILVFSYEELPACRFLERASS